jgi:hypothetical protein
MEKEAFQDSGFVAWNAVFDSHVLEFAGFKNFPTFQALDKFSVFFAGYDLHTRMLTRIPLALLRGDLRRRGWGHKSR